MRNYTKCGLALLCLLLTFNIYGQDDCWPNQYESNQIFFQCDGDGFLSKDGKFKQSSLSRKSVLADNVEFLFPPHEEDFREADPLLDICTYKREIYIWPIEEEFVDDCNMIDNYVGSLFGILNGAKIPQEGGSIEFDLNKDKNVFIIQEFWVKLDGLICSGIGLPKGLPKKIILYSNQNNSEDNDYEEDQPYESYDELWELVLDNQEKHLPCPGSYPSEGANAEYSQEYLNPSSEYFRDVKANVYIKYGESNEDKEKLIRPIIMVEGVDFGDNNIIDEDGTVIRYGTNGWENVIQGLDEGIPYVGIENEVIDNGELFRNYPGVIKELLNSVQEGEDDYDLVLIDFSDGADYIQNNGELVRKLINKVNNEKDCGYQNVVIGLSMGGQVARWALTTMESENEDHDTRLYISLDSPHMGANIPLSLQGLLWFLSKTPYSGLFAKQYSNISRPASKQMLYETFEGAWATGKLKPIYHSETKTACDPTSFWTREFSEELQVPNEQANCIREEYLNEMISLGYPKKCMNIGLANGSGSSVLQDGIDGLDDLCLLDLEVGNEFWMSLLDPLALLVDLCGYYDEIAYIEMFSPPGVNHLEMDFSRPFEKISLSNAILNVKIPTYTKPLEMRNMLFAVEILDQDMPSYDILPGCERNDIEAALISEVGHYDNCYENPIASADIFCESMRTCFMPSQSVAGMPLEGSSGSAEADYQENKATNPFDDFYYPIDGSNEPHVDINPNNITFLLEGENTNLPDQPSILPTGNERNNGYNFGLFHKIMPSCDIHNQGFMAINHEANTSYLYSENSQYYKSFPRRSNFPVWVESMYCDDEAVININEGGLLQVGDELSNTINKSAKLIITETGEVNVNQGGLLEVFSGSEIIIEDEGEMIITGGQLTTYGDARITVQGGGYLKIAGGSTVDILGNSKIFVEEGGVLEVEHSAGIYLESERVKDDGEILGSVVFLDGQLLLADGVIEVNGAGSLEFLDNHEIVWNDNAEITFKGNGIDYNTYYLSAPVSISSVDVVIDETRFFLKELLTVSETFSFKASKSMFKESLEAPVDFGLDLSLQNIDDVLFHEVNFSEVQTSVFGSSLMTLHLCNSENTFKSAFKLNSIINNRVSQTNLVGIESGFDSVHPKFGLENNQVINTIISRSSLITGFNSGGNNFGEDNNTTDDTKFGGILSVKSPYLYLENSAIENCNYGVLSPTATNIVMSSSEIGNCYSAIDMDPQIRAGSLKMICSHIYNSKFNQVNGENIELFIDAFINSQATDGVIRSNTFSFDNPVNNFGICYTNIDLEGEDIQATYNNWSQPLNAYVIKQSQNNSDCGNGSNIFLNQLVDEELPTVCNGYSDEDVLCQDNPPNFPQTDKRVKQFLYEDFCVGEIECLSGANILEYYWKGYNCYISGDIWSSLEYFIPLAKAKSLNQDYGIYCNYIIDFAYSFTYSLIDYVEGHDDFEEYFDYNFTEEESSSDLSIEIQCSQDTVDLVFLIDNSTSISDTEYDILITNVGTSIQEIIQQVGYDVWTQYWTYTVVQFAGENQIEVTIPKTNDIAQLQNIERAWNWGYTSVRSVFTFMKHYWDNGRLGNGSTTKREVVLVTDAVDYNYAAPPYDIYNEVKSEPINAEVTIIRYQSDNDVNYNSNTITAAVCSYGGGYFGEVDYNPGDPVSNDSPRKLIVTNFSEGEITYTDYVNLCDTLVFDLPEEFEDWTITWYSTHGGSILSDSINVTKVKVDVVGVYYVDLVSPDGCVLTYEYNMMPDDIQQRSLGSNDDRSQLLNGKIMEPHELEIDPREKLETNSFKVFPNPIKDHLNIQSNKEGRYFIEVVSIDGRVIEKATFEQKHLMKSHDWVNGIYMINIYSQDGFKLLSSSKIVKL